MGMFDFIDGDLASRIITKCPCCGSKIDDTDWQTKSFDDLMQMIGVADLCANDTFEMHTICDFCKHYIKLKVNTELKFNIIETKIE